MSESKSISKQVSSTKKRTKDPELSNYVFGKLPPQALDLEQVVLGAVMLEKDAFSMVVSILQPESFYDDKHKAIYAAMRELDQTSQPIDILTVTAQLKKMGQLEDAGGAFYVTDLTNRVASAANIEFHARIVAQKYVQRLLISTSTEIIKDSFEETTDVFDLLDKAERNLFDITENNLRKNYEKVSSVLVQAMEEIEAVQNSGEEASGIKSGFSGLDRMTQGFQSSDLIIVAARPGMGKTAFTLALTRTAAVQYERPVAFFSLEMGSTQLVKRLISAETEIEGEKFKKGTLQKHEWEQLRHQTRKLSNSPIFIDDTPGINVFELRAKCRRLKMQHDIQMVIIDYLQLMRGTGDSKFTNREQEISKISRSLKTLAKELDIPVIALSQLNRSVESRGGHKKPMLSDLRESGAIEQDADMVMFLYRPEYYDMPEFEDGTPSAGRAEVIIAKHRNGPTGSAFVRFIGRLAKFEDEDMGHNLPGNFISMNEATGPASGMAGGLDIDGAVTRPSRINTAPDDTPPWSDGTEGADPKQDDSEDEDNEFLA